MRHPPYHLRPNKAVDRVLLIETLHRLQGLNYDRTDGPSVPVPPVYYGFGGPFLHDFRLLNGYFPHLDLVSIESSEQTFKRQKFHRVSKKLKLKHSDVGSFLDTEFPDGQVCTFWLDYTNAKAQRFEELRSLLGKVGPGSVVKITIPAAIEIPRLEMNVSGSVHEEYERFVAEIGQSYDPYLKTEFREEDLRSARLVDRFQEMVRVASDRAAVERGLQFQCLQSFFYADHTPMLSVTGVLCDDGGATLLQQGFETWELGNTTWAQPQRIQLPILSLKERLHLEPRLPITADSVRSLDKALGYHVDDGPESSKRGLQQYRKFHSYYPDFAKVSL